MPNFYYTDENGQKGLINPQQLKALAVQGIITPDTPLETDTGYKGKAGQIKGLFAHVSSTATDNHKVVNSCTAEPKVKYPIVMMSMVAINDDGTISPDGTNKKEIMFEAKSWNEFYLTIQDQFYGKRLDKKEGRKLLMSILEQQERFKKRPFTMEAFGINLLDDKKT